jgi:4-amino-4-deoxy-L-arabinose transferase-like glycosyltransferase
MKNDKLTLLLLSLILILGFFLRTYQLTTSPLGLSENEASIGYNAYSLFKTGKDETGRLLPLSFESFGDDKSPIPIYLNVPFVAILGLNELSVRLASVFGGIFSILLLFILARLVTNKYSALMSALLLSISPWHVQISRTDAQVSYALVFFLLFLIFLIKQFRFSNYLVTLFFILGILTNPVLLLVELPIALFYLFKQRNKKKLLSLFICLVLICLAIFVSKDSIKAFYFNDPFYKEIGFVNNVNKLRGFVNQSGFGKVFAMVQNKYILFADQISKNYLKQFDWYYLFLGGDYKEPSMVTALGKLFSFELPLFLLGLYYGVKKKMNHFNLLVAVIFLSPLPGILDYHSRFDQTLFCFLVPFYILVGLGVTYLYKLLKFEILRYLLVGVVAVLIIGYGVTFYHYYFVHYPLESIFNRGYPYQKISQRIEKLGNQYDKVIISDKLAKKPYIYTLFNEKIDPLSYQNMNKQRGGSSFISTSQFGKYTFRSLNWSDENKDRGTLFIGFDNDLPIDSLCTDSKCTQYEDVLYLPNKDHKIVFIGIKKQ